jgi:cytochrome c-type biogenesis protein CcmH/NrfF
MACYVAAEKHFNEDLTQVKEQYQQQQDDMATQLAALVCANEAIHQQLADQ